VSLPKPSSTICGVSCQETGEIFWKGRCAGHVDIETYYLEVQWGTDFCTGLFVTETG
jgi:hypothetical protein